MAAGAVEVTRRSRSRTEPAAGRESARPDPVITPRLSDASFEAMVAEARPGHRLRRRGQGGAGPPGRREHGRGHRRRRPPPPVAPARAVVLGLLHAHPGRPAGRGQPGAAGGADRSSGAQPAPGRDHRPGPTTPSGILPRELLSSVKDSAEHRMVVEAIAEALGPLCSELDVPDHPDLVHLHNHHPSGHLGGRDPVRPSGRLRARPPSSWWPPSTPPRRSAGCPATGPSPSSPASSPSPGVTTPDRWATSTPGATGAGCSGSGPSRSTDRSARLAAGVGVVEGSEPRTERVETVLKLTAVFDALAPGTPSPPRTDPRHRDRRTAASPRPTRPSADPRQAPEGHRWLRGPVRRRPGPASTGGGDAPDHLGQGLGVVPGHEVAGPGQHGSSAPGMAPGQGDGGPGWHHQVPLARRPPRRAGRARRGRPPRRAARRQGPLLDHEGPAVAAEGAATRRPGPPGRAGPSPPVGGSGRGRTG